MLLARSATVVHAMLNLCDEYASKYSIVFNSSKSVRMLFAPKRRAALFVNSNPVFHINQWPHLGHIISCDLNDKHDIIRGRTTLNSQINNVLCFFIRNLDSVTKMCLIICYCCSLHGCTNWNITYPCIELVCSAWRAGMHRVGVLSIRRISIRRISIRRIPIIGLGLGRVRVRVSVMVSVRRIEIRRIEKEP